MENKDKKFLIIADKKAREMDKFERDCAEVTFRVFGIPFSIYYKTMEVKSYEKEGEQQ